MKKKKESAPPKDVSGKAVPYVVKPRGFFTWISVILMLLSVVIRLIYFVPKWQELDPIVYIIVPSLAGILFAVFLFAFGDKTLLPTVICVIGGVFFFMIKALTFESMLHTILCWVLYIAVLLIYTVSITGFARTKLLLLPLFGLPFLYHIFIEDMGVFWGEGVKFKLWDFLPEASVLLIMLSLFVLTFAMRKKKPKHYEGDGCEVPPPPPPPPHEHHED